MSRSRHPRQPRRAELRAERSTISYARRKDGGLELRIRVSEQELAQAERGAIAHEKSLQTARASAPEPADPVAARHARRVAHIRGIDPDFAIPTEPVVDAVAVQCVDSPTGRHVFSVDEEYAQKKGISSELLEETCEHCGEPKLVDPTTGMSNRILAAATRWAREEYVSERALYRLCRVLAKFDEVADRNLPDEIRAAFELAAKELKPRAEKEIR